MPRFFVNTNEIENNTLFVSGDDARHIARSIRMAVGDEVTLCGEDGLDYICRLTKIRDELCECDIIRSEKSKSEPPYPLTLFMAYPKGDKLETVIQKAVELGASEIIPFVSSRCIKRPDEKRAEARLERLNRIAEEAAKQCGRAKLPTVSLPLSFEEMLNAAKTYELALFCYEGDGTRSLKAVLDERSAAPAGVCAIVGSEGGFSPDEAERAIDMGLIPVNLGPRILRCETAPDYVLSALSYKFEL